MLGKHLSPELLLGDVPSLNDALDALYSTEYAELAPKHKLLLLRTLSDLTLDLGEVPMTGPDHQPLRDALPANAERQRQVPPADAWRKIPSCARP